MKFLVVLFAVVALAVARPQAPEAHHQPQDNTTPVTIVSQTEVVNADGSFNFSYETSNGIHVQQAGHIKQVPEGRSVNGTDEDASVQVIQGGYSYTAPDGQQISLSYVADDNGFQPQGSHLPTPPPAPQAAAQDGHQAQQPEQPQQPQA